MMTPFAENLWLMRYPVKRLGADIRRNVTLIRLRSGALVIHSTAPFSSQDVTEIRSLGPIGWIVEAMLRHDLFSEQAHQLFPDVPFLAPEGFSQQVNFPTTSITPPPSLWTGEIDALVIAGAPEFSETVFLHRPTRTVIVADLVLNFSHESSLWARLLARAGTGGQPHPAMSVLFRRAVKDHEAFQNSLSKLLSWDFDRVIVGHADPILTRGKEKLAHAFRAAGFAV